MLRSTGNHRRRSSYAPAHRLLSALMCGAMLGTPLMPASPALATSHPSELADVGTGETFTFGEQSSRIASPLVAGAQANAAKARSAPVSNTGAFLESLPFDLPPGRLGMTPALGLSYSSDGFRQDSPVGAGWSLGVASISRSVLRGFPKTVVDPALDRPASFGLVYDDDVAFDGPAGRMIPFDCNALPAQCPPQALGIVFAPVRERSPVRYEFRPKTFNAPGSDEEEDLWIEHSPDGTKRYFGALPSGFDNGAGDVNQRRARVENELGTHTWFLLASIDVNGNYISYEYRHVVPRLEADLLLPQRRPVFAHVRWGANLNLGLDHIFFARFLTEAYAGSLDMMRGHTILNNKVSSVEIGQLRPTEQIFWTYQLATRVSEFSGRLVLDNVQRVDTATGALTRAWSFAYSGRGVAFGELNTLFPELEPGGFDFITTVKGIYRDQAGGSAGSIEETIAQTSAEGARTPPNRKGGFRFMDFNGDGRTDIVYHPAGLQTVDARMLYEFSFLRSRTSNVNPDSWSQMDLLSTWPASVVVGDPLFSQLLDLDGDRDLDAIDLLPVIENRLDPNSINDIIEGSGLCADEVFWNECGDVDPIPFENEISPWPPGGVLGHDYSVEMLDLQSSTDGPGGCGLLGGGRCCLPLVQQCTALGAGDFDPPPEVELTIGDFIDGINFPVHLYRNAIGAGGAENGFGGSATFPLWPEGVRQQMVLDRTPAADPALVQYKPIVVLDVQITGADVDGDGRSEVVLLKSLRTEVTGRPGTNFRPRVYRFEAPSTLSIVEGFQASLGRNFGGRTYNLPASNVPVTANYQITSLRGNELAGYQESENPNAFLTDVNGDGLPDLIAGRLPIFTGLAGYCVGNHDVFLNRGYRWDFRADLQAGLSDLFSPARPASTSVALSDQTHPYGVLRARRGHCIPGAQVGGVEINDVILSSAIKGMAAMVQADINGDGRTDTIFADDQSRRVFIATNRGWRAANAAEAVAFEATPEHPALVVAATPEGGWNAAIPKPSRIADQARLVDMNNDGLADIVFVGREAANSGAPERPAMVAFNTGEVPDLLTGVTTLGGAETSVEYVASTSDAAVGVVGEVEGNLPAGLMLTKTIRRSAGPLTGNPIGRPFPVETIELGYEDFVRDVETSETLGFTTLTSTFHNEIIETNGGTFGSPVTAETVVVTQEFFGRDALQSGETLVGKRAPLKGLLRSVTVETDDFMTINETEYVIESLGDSVRVRQNATLETECLPDAITLQTCAPGSALSGRSEVIAYDAYGVAVATLSGNSSDGVNIDLGAEETSTVTTVEHRPAAWVLSLPTDEQSFGQTLRGGVLAQDLTAHQVTIYDDVGRPTRIERPGLSEAPCPGAAISDRVDFSYTATGQVDATTDWRGTVDRQFYNADELYAVARTIEYSAVQNGAPAAPRSLTETFQTDRRHGAIVRRVDFNGEETRASYDSLGRMLEERGPGGILLTRNAFFDEAPVRVLSTEHLGQGLSFDRQTVLDGFGNVLAVTEAGAGVPTIARSFSVFDAFGRMIEAHQPQQNVGLDPVPGTLLVRTTYDGFDRPVLTTLADGATATMAYFPRQTLSTNPRGFSSRRFFNWKGDLMRVSHLDDNDVRVLDFEYTVDGSGQLLGLTSSGPLPGGGSEVVERTLERDVGGRPTAITLPHEPGFAGAPFELCYYPDDSLVRIVTPQGRQTQRRTDGLGRTAVTFSQDQGGGQVFVLQNYDDADRAGLGRLTESADPSGEYSYRYDAFGRRTESTFKAADAVHAGEGSLQGTFTLETNFAQRGHLLSLSVITPEGFSFPATYTRDSYGRTTSAETAVGVFASNVDYDAFSAVTAIDFGNGVSTNYTYEPARRFITTIEHSRPGALLSSLSYGYDENGNVTTEGQSTVSALSVDKTFSYDALDRLTRSVIENGFTTDEAYGYSPSGNLLSAASDTYAYADPQNAQATTALTTAGATRSLTYDADGQMTVDDGARVTTLEWDARGCLVRTLTTSPNLVDERHVCAGDGRRVYRKSRELNTRERVLDPFGVFEVRPDTNVLLLTLPVGATTSYEEAYDLVDGTFREAESGFRHLDARGSVVARSDFAAGGVAEEAVYGPWGAVLDVGLTTVTPEHSFLGSEADSGTGWHRFGPRAYDPTLRRWTSGDMLALLSPASVGRGDLGVFSYAANNPTTFTDKTGLIADRLSAADAQGFQEPLAGNPEINKALVGIGLLTAISVASPLAGVLIGIALGFESSEQADLSAALGGGPGKLAKVPFRMGTRTTGVAGKVGPAAKNAAPMSPMARGRAAEKRVLDDLGLPKNSMKVRTKEGVAIPDALTKKLSVEIKDCMKVSCTKQIRIQTDAAKASGRESVLVTGNKTNVNKNAKKAFDKIERRSDLGPQ